MKVNQSLLHRFNPESLSAAREYRGIKKKELAEKIGVTSGTISQLESGRIKPNAATLSNISLALQFSPTFFTKRSPGDPVSDLKLISSDSCHFRSLRSSTHSERHRMLAAASIVGQSVDFLSEFVNFPVEGISDLCTKIKVSSNSPEDIAAQVRELWDLGLGPISNMVALLETHGVLVFRLLSDCRTVDAFSAWRNGRPFVFLNMDKGSATRSRFDAAHELGHLLMHPDCVPGDPKHEAEANQFAAAFLLPKNTYLAECPPRLNWAALIELKGRWKISLKALIKRAFDIGMFSEFTYRRAMMQWNARFKGVEGEEPEEEIPSLLRSALSALSTEDNPHSLSTLSEVMGVREKDLEELLLR